jgi:DNA repair exonuclease SbcCD ATPase subunit
MDPTLQRLLWDRIDADASLGAEAGLLIMAAADGPEALQAALEGQSIGDPQPAPADAPAQAPTGAYLGPITVEGFRGIGPKTVLPLQLGPGVTLVVGRNGSGKSRFAEAVEMLLTGDNRRWTGRPVIWREGWRNLHQPLSTQVSAELAVEGAHGRTTVRRYWPASADLEQSGLEIQPHGQPKSDRLASGWQQALVSFRPFLSYNELGSMLDEKPSKLYDALSSILGLEDLVEVESLLGDVRRDVDKRHKDAKKALQPLSARLEPLDDLRARRCAKALSGTSWDLQTAEAVLLGTADSTQGIDELDLLRQLCSIEGPGVEQVMEAAERLRDTAGALDAVAGSDAERAHTLADILQRALELHADHGDSNCPVCGHQGALDASWRAAAEAQTVRLRETAEAVAAARRQHRQALREATELLTDPPAALSHAEQVGVDASAAVLAWSRWAQDPAGEEDPLVLAEHLEDQLDPLLHALETVRNSAHAKLDQKESEWRPIARDLLEWLPAARQAQHAVASRPALDAAERWIKQTTSELRDERFGPVATEAQRIWELLRQQSNVELARLELEGTGTRRRVKLDVTVDGVGGAALSVMSQGELHSLALSLFLPRAMLAESPFRFVVLDDPVQSMDPARVDGLARVLEEVGRTRQLVVFTHDDRLPEAFGRLGLDASILEVTRQPGSVVSVIEALDPVERHLRDARTLAKDEALPPELAGRLVPGFCRTAIEAACTETVRRRRLSRGEPHDTVEQLLVGLTTSKRRMALALFDDPNRAGEVLAGLNNRFGRRAGDVFRALNDGAHGQFTGDLPDLIHRTRDLAVKLRSLT